MFLSLAAILGFMISHDHGRANAFSGISKEGPRCATRCGHDRIDECNLPAFRRSCLPSRDTRIQQSSLSALIYGVDGTVMKDDEFENNDYKLPVLMLDEAIGDQNVWTRIACAFAPPPHNHLVPELVLSTQLVKVGSTGIDIALGVVARDGPSTNDQLAQVLVTVGYPQPWIFESDEVVSLNNNETLPILVQQVRILDGHANDRLKQRSKPIITANDPRYYEKMVVENRWMERLQEEDSETGMWAMASPPLSSIELLDECKLLKKLLNEDEFEDELRALFVKHYNSVETEDDSDGAVVLRAAVASIGSLGLYLKARVTKRASQAASVLPEESPIATMNDDDPSESLLAIAIPYGEGSANTKTMSVDTVDELREAVLLLVESVDPMPLSAATMSSIAKTDDSSTVNADTFVPYNEQVVAAVNKLESKELDSVETEDSSTTTSAIEIDESLEDVTKKPPVVEDEQEHNEPLSISMETTTRMNPQPKSPEEEAKLAAKYAAIEDLGERAFVILRDLNMI